MRKERLDGLDIRLLRIGGSTLLFLSLLKLVLMELHSLQRLF